jgi:hypothetical protein
MNRRSFFAAFPAALFGVAAATTAAAIGEIGPEIANLPKGAKVAKLVAWPRFTDANPFSAADFHLLTFGDLGRCHEVARRDIDAADRLAAELIDARKAEKQAELMRSIEAAQRQYAGYIKRHLQAIQSKSQQYAA